MLELSNSLIQSKSYRNYPVQFQNRRALSRKTESRNVPLQLPFHNLVIQLKYAVDLLVWQFVHRLIEVVINFLLHDERTVSVSVTLVLTAHTARAAPRAVSCAPTLTASLFYFLILWVCKIRVILGSSDTDRRKKVPTKSTVKCI